MSSKAQWQGNKRSKVVKARQGKQQGMNNKIVKTIGHENESNKTRVARCDARIARHNSKCNKAHQQGATTRVARQ